MELILERIAKKKTYTIGRLYLKASPIPSQGGGVEIPDSAVLTASLCNQTPPPSEGLGEAFCDTLEPTWRDYANGAYKVKGRSAIPEGRYAVVISYSPKFKQWLPILLGGPDFNRKWQGIRIHAGNCSEDTEGCILVGKNREVGKVLDSRIWVHRLKQKIVEAKARGEVVWLTIK